MPASDDLFDSVSGMFGKDIGRGMDWLADRDTGGVRALTGGRNCAHEGRRGGRNEGGFSYAAEFVAPIDGNDDRFFGILGMDVGLRGGKYGGGSPIFDISNERVFQFSDWELRLRSSDRVQSTLNRRSKSQKRGRIPKRTMKYSRSSLVTK